MGDDLRMGAESCRWISLQTVAPFYPKCAISPSMIYPYYILYPEQQTFTNYYALFPLHYKQLRPGEVCSLDDAWSFTASHSLMHFINRCTLKSSQ